MESDKLMTVDALMKLAQKMAAAWHENQSSRVVAAYDDGDVAKALRAAIEQYGREQYARGVNDAWPAGRGSGEPIAMLHDDGHWTHPPGRDPLDRFSGKVRMEVYAAPQSREPLTEEQIDRHTLLAQECPPGSKVILVSSLRRLRARGIRSEG